MTLRIVEGPLIAELEIDEKAHRVYRVRHRIESDDLGRTTVGVNEMFTEGPDKVAATAGLPEAGELWGGRMEFEGNVWAYCLPNMTIKKEPAIGDGPSKFWQVDQLFTTKGIERAIDHERGDPFLELPKVSGGTVKFTEEAVYDRHGSRIVTSSLELIRGPQNEWDMSRPSFRVEQQVSDLDQERVESMMNCVNDAPMWGLPYRALKLSDWSWTELFHRYSRYFVRTLMFEGWTRRERPTDPLKSGWDRDVLDEGTKVLRGRWQNFGTATSPVWQWVLVGNPNPLDPRDFVRYQDVNGNITRVILDGSGRPYVPAAGATTNGCSQCPSGAPQKWDVGGFPGWEPAVNGTLLDYSAGSCLWSKSITGRNGQTVTIALSYLPADSLWDLSITGLKFYGENLVTQRWTKAGADWQCLGSNVLDRSASNHEAAYGTLTVTPAVANSPGAVHIEKYPEANFLELDVPAVIGQQ